MNITFLVHSVVSCWNNGNAHFQRGVISALEARGHHVQILEPRDGWSRVNFLREAGTDGLAAFAAAFPCLRPQLYSSVHQALELLEAGEPDLVVVHEWNAPELVNAIGVRRKTRSSFRLLFHDTHHRAVSEPDEINRFDLSFYDGVLAFGASIARVYERRGWARRVWTWHEAADTRRFRPQTDTAPDGDLVWIGNWGDGERSDELRELLLKPAAALGLRSTIHGVRYPETALAELARRGIRYGGWLANHLVPEIFARHRLTVHVPRRPYAKALRGIPTIRVFEALACGIPLISGPWADDENLFPKDAYLSAENAREMERAMRAVLEDGDLAGALREKGLAAIMERHSCDHRAEELLNIYRSLRGDEANIERRVS